jgi:hypothetical protein
VARGDRGLAKSAPPRRCAALAGSRWHRLAATPDYFGYATLQIESAQPTKARAVDSLKIWSSSDEPFTKVKSVKARAEVRARAMASRAQVAGCAEGNGSFAGRETRAQKRACQ